MPTITRRKRLSSEQNDGYGSSTEQLNGDDDVKKRTKKGIRHHESKDKFHPRNFFESTRHCRSAPGKLLYGRNLTHATSLSNYIKDVSSTQKVLSFLPPLSRKTSDEKNMLAIHQQPEIAKGDQTIDKSLDSQFLTCSELAAYITAMSTNVNPSLLIIDCGSLLRYTERRIRDSFLLNVNDKISRKRLATRGLRNFLDTNQWTRLEKSDLIVLYDDFTRPSVCSPIQSQLSPTMKCIYEEIKRYDLHKTLYVLQSPFDEFYQHYSNHCYVSTSTDDDLSSTVETITQMEIDFSEMSQILPGLFLGNASDAENLDALRRHGIQTIINVSTSIPCFFENDHTFEYRRLACHDSANQNILQHFESIFEYISEKLTAEKNILIHCQGGVSRSPSFVIGYLMRYHSKTFDQAHQLVRDKRNIINPNFNFLGQLTQYQQILSDV